MAIPKEIQGKKYISLTTFRNNGLGVKTPVWFAEEDDRVYVMTRSDSGKYKRIRNNPQVKLAPCTMSGKITGPEFAGQAQVLPRAQWPDAKKALHREYWMSRLPFWSKKNEFLEIAVQVTV